MNGGLFSGLARTTATMVPQMKTAPVSPPNAPRRRGGLFNFDRNVSGNDRLMALAATLADLGQGGTSNLQSLREQQQENAERAARNTAMIGLQQALSGSPPVAGQSQTGGIPTLRQAAPALLAAQRAGIPIGDYISLLDKTGPDINYEQGFRYDRRDPNSAPAYAPDLGEGQAPVMQNGQVQSVQNLSGYVDANAARERAINDARNASTASYAGITAENTAAGTGRGAAPYAIETVQGPNGPITASRSTFLGMGQIAGQNPIEVATAEAYGRTMATNRAEAEESRRVAGSAASRMIPTLYSMEQRLPDVIAGLGSDYRRLGNQVLGALGNDRAQERVTATETYENEARQIVAQMIRSFGPSPTEGERKYSEQMSGADVRYTPETLAEGARLTRSRAARDIEAAGGTAEGLGEVVQDDSGRRLIWNGFDWVPL